MHGYLIAILIFFILGLLMYIVALHSTIDEYKKLSYFQNGNKKKLSELDRGIAEVYIPSKDQNRIGCGKVDISQFDLEDDHDKR